MKILGVDPALSVTGYGIISFEKNRFTLLEAGVIKTLAQQTLTERLRAIHAAMDQLLSETKPSVMVLEKLYAHHRHPVTAYLLGHARGTICLACAQHKIPLVEYAATRVKKAIVGKGQASKLQVQRMVDSLLKLKHETRSLDVSDALALAITHSYILKSKI
jgi:crossover junction endodeoxyribonuclease RuvC